MSSFTFRQAVPLMGLAALALGVGGAALRVHADETKQPAAAPIAGTFTLDPLALVLTGKPLVGLPYYPTLVVLSDARPPSIKKEPAYKGTPQYGMIHLGNGPKAEYAVVVDTPADGDAKIYVDKNHNGDLTDDGDGAWSKKTPRGAQTMYGPNVVVMKASWGKDGRESSSGDYGVNFYFFAGKDPAGKAQNRLFGVRAGVRSGTITLNGMTHKALLVENDTDGLFNKPVETDKEGEPITAPTSKPVWLVVDLKDDGKFASGPVDIRAPFELDGKVYEAKVNNEGSKLSLTPSTRAVAALGGPVPLKAGRQAPAFQAEKYGGGTLQLADYKGKVVILDFWATWCSPCQRSMPHIEKVYQGVKDQGVEVVGVCVWDTKAEYEKWMPDHKSQYTFTFAFDPAAKDTPNSIAYKLYKVNGIPTTYIIGKDGKVVDAIVGYSGDNDKRVEEALKKAGITVKESAESH